jgi:hypothetical protein
MSKPSRNNKARKPQVTHLAKADKRRLETARKAVYDARQNTDDIRERLLDLEDNLDAADIQLSRVLADEVLGISHDSEEDF